MLMFLTWSTWSKAKVIISSLVGVNQMVRDNPGSVSMWMQYQLRVVVDDLGVARLVKKASYLVIRLIQSDLTLRAACPWQLWVRNCRGAFFFSTFNVYRRPPPVPEGCVWLLPCLYDWALSGNLVGGSTRGMESGVWSEWVHAMNDARWEFGG